MMRAWCTGVSMITGLSMCVVSAVATAHPWHRHREHDAVRPVTERKQDDDRIQVETPAAVASHIRLTAAAEPKRPGSVDIADAFEPFVNLKAISCRSDDHFFFVESNGVPDHPLMVGIRAWQQQVPLPQPYVGDNAWRIPLHPVPAASPMSTKDLFLRGAIALAVNGVPIFNPLNNRGEDAFLVGELDEYGGHCGRADDYHYHIAPVHLEKQVGKGMPIAYALDGYPIYGYVEPDGSAVKGLDRFNGHEDTQGNYHYHATKSYPYLNGGFHGEVTERDGQVDPQPRAEPLRPALPPLRGATILAFTSPTPTSRRLTYEVSGRKGVVAYSLAADGAVAFEHTDPTGTTTRETYVPRGHFPGGRLPGGPHGPAARGKEPPPRPARPADGSTRLDRQARERLVVTSPAIGPDGRLPVEFTCDGAGASPPLAWKPGPAGTKSYAVILWHDAPDQTKSYWVVYDIPGGSTQLEKNSRHVGTTGLNDKRRAEYDPMCSKGPGVKTYHVTVYALSGEPDIRPDAASREALLDAIRDMTLAEGTLTFTYERGGRR